jgi:hypothetical protein
MGVVEDDRPLLPLDGMMASPTVLEAPTSMIGITLEGVIEDGIFRCNGGPSVKYVVAEML